MSTSHTNASCTQLAAAALSLRWLLPLLLALLGAHVPPACAARMPASLAEFKHDAWSIERGAPSRINSITQTSDGFLWIGSVEGLFRFDGVSFEPAQLAGPMPRFVVSRLRTSRSGTLWVGLARGRGVARLEEGRLVDARMPNPSREVNDIQEDSEGGIWIARGGRSDRTLARFHHGTWTEFGREDGLPAQQVWALHFSRDGSLWVVMSHCLARRRPGETHFRVAGPAITPQASLAEDARGEMWISDARGTRALARPSSPETFFAHPKPVGGTRLLFDRNGDLWTTTWNGGVLVIREPGRPLSGSNYSGPRVASLDASAGLTSDQTRALFQDREGNIWVGTELGLDLLRPASVIIDPDLPRNSPTSYRMAAALDGTVYVADAQALYAIAPGRRPQRVIKNSSPAEALCAAGDKGVWLFLADRVLRVESGAVRRLAKPASTTAYGCAEDAAGRLWMPALERGLHWMNQGIWQRWPDATPSTSLPANAALDRDGRAVVLFRATTPAGDLPFLPLEAGRSEVGGVEGLLPTRSGLLLSGNRGLAAAQSSFDVQRFGESNAWSASLNGLAQTREGETWAIGDAGIVRLRSADLSKAWTHPGQTLPHRILDYRDGLNSFVQKAPGAQVAVGGDGRVWFLTRRNVVRVHPASLVFNRVPPPVLVRSVHVGDQAHQAASQMTLPPGTTTVRIAFTALSLSVPERVQFQYRLVGARESWSTPNTARSALLSDLTPGDYRFEVRASNNDGVWSDTPAHLTLVIPPTFTQSLLFKLGAVVLTLMLLYAAYATRVRQLMARTRERSDERARERERIAGDMHDTLLQSVQGLILRFQSVSDRLNDDPRSRRLINQALDQAEAVLIDGRDRLQGLRGSGARDFEEEVQRLIAGTPFGSTTQASIRSEGNRQRLRPDVFDEALFIVGEALFNAARHAHATSVSVLIDYGRRQFTVGVHDNGVGIDGEAATRAERSGHFGMCVMRERAERIGAKLQVQGQCRPGTRISFCIGSAIAYLPNQD